MKSTTGFEVRVEGTDEVDSHKALAADAQEEALILNNCAKRTGTTARYYVFSCKLQKRIEA